MPMLSNAHLTSQQYSTLHIAEKQPQNQNTTKMKFLQSIAIPFVLLATSVSAVAQQKSVIVSFPNDTPAHVLDQAKAAVLAAGGVITHEYKIIKAFACTASSKAFDTVNELSVGFNPVIEEDQIVTINNKA